MLYTVERELYAFQAWGGAAPRLEALRQHRGAFDYVESVLDELGKGWSETKINDFIWFELDELLMRAGYMDVDGHYTDDAD